MRLDGHSVDHAQTLYLAYKERLCTKSFEALEAMQRVQRQGARSPHFPQTNVRMDFSDGWPVRAVVSLVDGRLTRNRKLESLSDLSLLMAWHEGQRHALQTITRYLR